MSAQETLKNPVTTVADIAFAASQVLGGVTVTGAPTAVGQVVTSTSGGTAAWQAQAGVGGSLIDNLDGTATSGGPAFSSLYFNVKDTAYGATGNGSTDDTTAIQTAIAAAAVIGGTVYFPPGTYMVSASLIINADNVRLLGSGYATVIKAGTGFPDSTSMILVQAPGGTSFRQGLVIEQLKIDGNNKTGATGVELVSTYHAQLQHIWIQHCIGKGLYLNGTSTAFGAYTNITSVQITDGGAGKGVDTDRHEHCIFTGCVFAWHEQTGGIGVRSQSSNMVFQGCKFDACDISLDMEFCVANVVVACDFDRAITNHLFMNGAKQTRIVGNQFSNRYLSSGVDMISVGNSGNKSNIFVANVALPSSGFTTFIRELSGITLGNQYIGNDPSGLVNVFQTPTPAITAEVNLNTSTTETTLVTTTLAPGLFIPGTTFRCTIRGTLQTQATSGALTFRDYLGANVSTETYVMPTQTGASGPVGFMLVIDSTVRTVGASGTYVSHGYGRIDFATPVTLSTTTATTAIVDTTATSSVLKVTAQWATSSATNILKVETATIEQIV